MQEIVKDLRQLAADIRDRKNEECKPAVSELAGKVNVWAFTAVMFMLCILAILVERSHSMSKIERLIQINEQREAEDQEAFDRFYKSAKQNGFDFQKAAGK